MPVDKALRYNIKLDSDKVLGELTYYTDTKLSLQFTKLIVDDASVHSIVSQSSGFQS